MKKSQLEASPIINLTDWQRKIPLPSPLPLQIYAVPNLIFLLFYLLVSPQNITLQVENWQSIILQKQSVSAACRLLNPHVFLSLIGLLPQSEIIHSASCKPNQKLWLQLQGLKSLLEAKLLVLFCSLIKHIRYMMLLDLVLKIWRTCVAQLNFIL